MVNKQFVDFTAAHPALIPLFALIFSITLYFSYLESFWALSIFLLFLDFKRAITYFLPLFILFLSYLYIWIGNPSFKGELEGKAHLHVHELNLSKSAFGTCFVLKGFIKEFRAQSRSKLKHLPFTLYVPKGVSLPLFNSDFLVEGTLKKSDFYGYSLKVKKEVCFERIPKTFSLAQRRYELKKKFGHFITSKVYFKNASTILIGMSSGDFQDSYLSFTFSRFGLNHLLAISGFHFAILALFLNFFFKFIPQKIRLILLGILLTLFYLFVGYGPSLQRAWIVFLIYLLGTYQERFLTSVNVLSLSMIFVLILNPFMLFNLGFQFSFAVTFAILLYYQPLFNWLKKGFVKRSKLDEMILKAVALGLSVHLTALPLSLYHFHKFYLMGFIFNLWVPLLMSFFLFAFMGLLILFPFSSFIATKGFWLLGYLLEKVLLFIFWIPTSFDYSIRVSFCSSFIIVLYLGIFLLISSTLQKKKETFFVKYYE